MADIYKGIGYGGDENKGVLWDADESPLLKDIETASIRKEYRVDGRSPDMKLNDALKKISELESRIKEIEGEYVTKIWLNDFLNNLFSSVREENK